MGAKGRDRSAAIGAEPVMRAPWGRQDGMSRHRWLTTLCLIVAVAFAARNLQLAAGFWFDGPNAWAVLFRPFPDWGTGADLYGALLPAKWIGTRNMWYAGGLLAVTFFVF